QINEMRVAGKIVACGLRGRLAGRLNRAGIAIGAVHINREPTGDISGKPGLLERIFQIPIAGLSEDHVLDGRWSPGLGCWVVLKIDENNKCAYATGGRGG